MVAWLTSGGTTVHVTPLGIATGGEITRAGPDTWVDGTELSGLVTLDDGFALLTRRPDLGEPLDGTTPVQATYFVRLQTGRAPLAIPLTGTKSITNPSNLDLKRDFPTPSGLSGRLAFNGLHYAAYFPARGGQGDAYATHYGDKFVQLDESGQLVQSWRMGCRVDLGNRLITEASGFLTFCLSDGTNGEPGLSLVLGAFNTRRLALESASTASNYAGGNWGSAVKVSDEYLVAWASRGWTSSNGGDLTPAHESHDLAIALLDKDRNPVGPPFWAFKPDGKTPLKDVVNVHAAPWGDKVLLVWETIDSPQFRSTGGGYSTGTYGGTHFRLVDAQGKPVSDEEIMPAAIAPNGPDEIVQFPNRDLGWAYVPEATRDFQTPVTATTLASVPPIYEIKFVRLPYCTP
jgi:hypothetical protein